MNALLPADSRGSMAMDYMADHFGGSEFVFIRVDGNLQSPVTLHGIEALTTKLEGIDGIYDVMHVGVLLSAPMKAWSVDEDYRPVRLRHRRSSDSSPARQ